MKENDIYIIYGNDPRHMTLTLLEEAMIEELIPKSSNITLKPNLVNATIAEKGATTHPKIIVAIIDYLKRKNYKNISIAESSWIGCNTAQAFKVCEYEKIAKTYHIPLIDIKKDIFIKVTAYGISMEISKAIMETDFLISIPVLKGHCQTTITCALKNMKGCISDRSKRQFHSMGLHKPIAALNTIKKANLVIVDSINGDLDFEEGGNPVHTNRMFMGLDSVLIDAFGANLMGFEVNDIAYIDLAVKFGVGSATLNNANIITLNNNKDINHIPHKIFNFVGTPKVNEYVKTDKLQQLKAYTRPSAACSACYGNLLHALARLKEKNTLKKLKKPIFIGQDYKDKSIDGLGIGSCTKNFSFYVPGCPPNAIEIVRFLKEYID